MSFAAGNTNKSKLKFKGNGTSRTSSIGGGGGRETGTSATKAGQQQISAYLGSNPEFLEQYVLNHVDLETLERWTIRKAKTKNKSMYYNLFDFFIIAL